MIQLSFTEENYLKAIFSVKTEKDKGASTTVIANILDTKASSVTDMIKKLADKNLVNYKKYYGVTLTELGKKSAIQTIRKQRLWEVFLVNKLAFGWDEVHEIAEQLEHIQSIELTNRLEKFLEYPKFDPHGDPIPDKEGNMAARIETKSLSRMKPGEKGTIVGVKDTSTEFLQFLKTRNLVLGTHIEIDEIFEYDNSLTIKINEATKFVSEQVSKNIIIKIN